MDLENDSEFLDYNIFIRVTSEKNKIVSVPINEVITGSFSFTTKDNYYHYYSLRVPLDSNKLIIELKCEYCIILVNYGSEIPTFEKKDWSFTGGEKTFYN